MGRYGVDLTALERVALPALGDPGTGGVVVIDELGRMELASAAFRDAVQRLLGTDCSLVATLHAHRHKFTDALKRQVEVTRLDASNRDRLPAELADRLLSPSSRSRLTRIPVSPHRGVAAGAGPIPAPRDRSPRTALGIGAASGPFTNVGLGARTRYERR